MKFFDKVKSMFTEEAVEEEEEEIQVEQIKKEVTHVAIESPNAKEEVEEVTKPTREIKSEQQPAKNSIFFSDHDFDDLNKPRHVQPKDKKDEYFSKEELAKMYGVNAMKEKKEEKKEREFKPTPIISPIYGILDKNYHKEDIVEKKEAKSTYKPNSRYSIDSVRNKAYGTLEEQLQDEVLNTGSYQSEDHDLFEDLAKEKKPIVFDDDMNNNKKPSEEVTMDLTKELDDLLAQKQASINATTRVAKNKDLANDVEKIDLFGMYDDRKGDE